jgi:hypothetical protein
VLALSAGSRFDCDGEVSSKGKWIVFNRDLADSLKYIVGTRWLGPVFAWRTLINCALQDFQSQRWTIVRRTQRRPGLRANFQQAPDAGQNWYRGFEVSRFVKFKPCLVLHRRRNLQV